MRRSGILLPIFSLPSNYGIGTMGKEAYRFIDFLKEGKQSFWQILPLGPTSYGDSPYQSFSTFAGNPYFIDLDMLCDGGILKKESIEAFDYGSDERYIDYQKVYHSRYKTLKFAFKNGSEKYRAEIEKFKELNSSWIYDYALFMALKDHFKGITWKEWEKDIRFREKEALNRYSDILSKECDFYIFLQYLFFKQWDELKKYASENGVEIIGDIPIYVSEDSADTWSHPSLFLLDKDLYPKQVAGCPPDAFTKEGQLWGNTVYDWEELKRTGYKWWIERIKFTLGIVDVARIDHFRGFESYYSIPYGEKNAVNGTWEKGPGRDIFDVIKNEIGEIKVIAEDLGFITDEVKELLNVTGYPGMRILQFAFDPDGDSEYLPHNYDKNVVVYIGTHDNDTVKGWFKELPEREKEFCKSYTGMKNKNDNWAIIKTAIASVADTAIIQMQDLLKEDSKARTNIPSTVGLNWKWRLRKKDINSAISTKLNELTRTYRR